MKSRITTVIFDMFETLVPNDPSQWIEVFQDIIRTQRLEVSAQALWTAWKKHEVMFREARLDLKDFSKNPPFRTYAEAWLESFNLAFGDLGLRGDSTSALAACMDALRHRDPYPETQAALDGLRGSFRLGLLSNADDDYLYPVLKRNGLRFDGVLTSEAARTYKPDPRLFREAALMLGAEVAQCAYVGDRQFEDVLGSRLAGMRCVWINRAGASLKPDLPAPDATVLHLTDLPGAIAAIERAPAVS